MLYTYILLNGIKIAYNTYNGVSFNFVMYSILISWINRSCENFRCYILKLIFKKCNNKILEY